MRILVTGATGFVGGAVLPALSAAGHTPIAAVRRAPPMNVASQQVGSIGPDTDWSAALKDIDAVVHLAGRAHRRDGASENDYQKVNAAGTERLAAMAATAGVRRLIFVSTIKVHGERTPDGGPPFRETDIPAPDDAYARSKLAGEHALEAIADGSAMASVILRPPLVYGPKAPANFRALVDLCDRAPPLPLASIRNRRSLIAVGNLAAAIVACLDHPAAPGRIFPVCDGEDLSTPELVRRIAKSLGRPARLFPCPVSWLRLAGTITGKRAAVQRLTESLAVDGSAICKALDWQPPLSVDAALAETAKAWRAHG